MLTIFEGRLDEGERLAQRALELGQRAEGQNLMAAFGGQLLIIRWQQGRLEELRSLIMQSRSSQPKVKLWSAVLAFIESEAGNMPAAREEFEQLATGRFASIPNEDTLLVVLVLAALVCAALGDGLRAEELYELLLPYDGRNIVVSEGVACVGAAAHYLGLLAAAARRWDDAEAHFESAIDLNRKTGGQPWLAHAQFELAKMLLARRGPGDRVRSRDLLRSSLGIARDSGMHALQGKIEVIQRGHRRLLPDRPDALTARELEILALIAGGHSTKEISERLVLSPRTTARHITNVYAKIGVRNRVEASAYFRKHNPQT
jgi:DNA-binding CsgD family transcriptional regulator